MSQAGYDKEIFADDNVMTGTATIYSDRFSMRKGSLFSMHFSYAGSTPTGTLTLWNSNKADPDPDSVTDWVENTDVTFTAIAGDGKQFHTIGNAAAKFYMVRYVNASGTGVLVCDLFGGKGA